MNKVNDIKKKVQNNRENIIQFLRDIVAIPSMDGQLKDVGERIQAEMRTLGFDETRFDKMGNTLGRIGSGSK
jgi:acetylornithine deacetylase/succinyl-diaminopimelate desuccinylase-like protein